jgi:RNA polymerase sigma factor (sigma-70 family)
MERLCLGQKQVLMSYVSINKVLGDYECFLNFKKGDENALAYLYKHFHKSLLFHGLKIVQDPFEVNSVIQEAFLKTWQLRGRLTSLPHTYRFIRLNVTWGCYSYYRRAGTRLGRQVILTDNIDFFGYSQSMLERENEEQAYIMDEEKVQAIYKVLPYLPANQQTILTLYFKYGLSYKQIAKRFGASNQAISQELHKGLEHLKTVIHAKKKLDTPAKPTESRMPYEEILDGELLQLFRLRYEMKLSFDAIATKMNLPQAYVQQQYVTAHIRLLQLTKKGK